VALRLGRKLEDFLTQRKIHPNVLGIGETPFGREKWEQKITKNIGKNGKKWWKNEKNNSRIIFCLAINMATHITMAIFLATFWAAFSLKITPPFCVSGR